MSFLRHARSIGPMGQLKTILRLKPCGATRWWAPGFAAGRDCNTAPSLIVRDEYAPAIPWRVALQQSLPPFHRMRPVCYESICRSRDFHRTASCVLTVCLGPGGHRIRGPRPFLRVPVSNQRTRVGRMNGKAQVRLRCERMQSPLPISVHRMLLRLRGRNRRGAN